MASSSSWFTKSASSKTHDYELPRWHPRASMSASIIPPPIVQSIYGASPKRSTVLPTRSVIIEKPLAIESRETEIQADLQFLLDAQAEGLIKGLAIAEDASSGSTTPTVRDSGVLNQVNRPVRKRLGLRSARKGIYGCMLTLAGMKEDEIREAESKINSKEAQVSQIEAWEHKRAGLQEATNTVNDDQETIRIQRLRQEADNVQEDINRVEMQLMELKTKQKRILKQVGEIENSVQAKLSSYTTSLSILEADIRNFLASTPDDLVITNDEQSVWQVPPSRRTLSMVKQQLATEQRELQDQKNSSRKEKEALNEGSSMWKEVAGLVTEFERRLRSSVSASRMTDSTQAWDDSSTKPEHVNDLHAHLQTLIADLEQKIKLAENRNWRLLIAAIGAELDALRRGEKILSSLVDTGEEKSSKNKPNGRAKSDTDDEPDPDLLFSVQDDDADD